MKFEKPKALNNTSTYSFTSPNGDHKIMISVFGSTPKEYFLSSLRFIDTSSNLGELEDMLAAQCNNLKRKIDFIESKEFCPVKYSDMISCGRIFVLSKTSSPSESAFLFIRDCITDFQKSTNFRLILQPDYDQFSIKDKLAKYISIPSFRLNHIPSAYSTVLPFAEILEQLGIANPSVGIIGIGSLGGEVIRLFTQAYPHVNLYVTDIDYQKYLPFKNSSRTHWVELESFYSQGYDAIIFCANNGSFTLDVAAHIINMKKPACKCIGGPEAGLDSSLQSISLVEKDNIIYVPSRLCGSLGLLTNLQEVLEEPYDFDTVKEEYLLYIRSVVTHSLSTGIKLSECLNESLTV